MFPSCRATRIAFLDSLSGVDKAICSAMNHSGSAIVTTKPANLFLLAQENASISDNTHKDSGSKTVKMNLGIGAKTEVISNVSIGRACSV
jgi:hypothetical protein